LQSNYSSTKYCTQAIIITEKTKVSANVLMKWVPFCRLSEENSTLWEPLQ